VENEVQKGLARLSKEDEAMRRAEERKAPYVDPYLRAAHTFH